MAATFSSAATLANIRCASYPQKVRVVFDFDGQAYYGVVSDEGTLVIAFPSCEVAPKLGESVEINDWVVKNVELKRSGEYLIASIPILYPVSFNLFPLGGPSRLVVDFGRVFTKTEKGGRITDAIEYMRVVKGGEDGYTSAQVLKVDPKRSDIYPAMAQPKGSFFDFLMPWTKRPRKHFYRARTSDIAVQNGAAAAVNATYFSETGRPFGVLMINGEAVSYPISDRTSLILMEDGRCFIDNIIMDSYFEYGGLKFEITGINEPRESRNDIIIYNRRYGELTESDGSGFEITVVDGKVTGTRIGNSRIPEDGYVLSAGALYAEALSQSVRIGGDVRAAIHLIPYSSLITGRVVHLIGGGPRLLKNGMVYISKYEENFRRDVARGRAARTAVGITDDGKLLFVTVDGKPRRRIRRGEGFSIGMSLTELAYFLRSLGAVEALNLDGGGSTTMVVNGCVINRPANGSEQLVSNAVIIKPRNTF